MNQNSDNWKEVSLADIAEMQYGYTASANDEKVGPKFLRITDIVPELINWNDVPYCAIEERNLYKYKLKEGDIVIARTGATAGYAKLIRNAPLSIFASYLIRLKLREGFHPGYIGRVIESDIFKKFILQCQGGAAQPQANAPVIKLFSLLVPPIDSQKKIATILTNYDELIQNNHTRVRLLEEMAQLLYREWFVEFRFPGYDKHKFVDSELGKIPEGWEIAEMSELVKIRGGYAYDVNNLSDSKTPYIITTMGSVKLGERFNKSSSKYLVSPPDKRYKLEYGDIILCTRDVTQNADVLGYPALIPDDSEYYLGSNLYRVKPKKDYLTKYLYYFYRSWFFRAWVKSVSNGANVLMLNQKDLNKAKVTVPPVEELKKFNDVIDPVDTLIENLDKVNRKLIAMRDLLLPKLMSGEIDVSKLDINITEN